MKPQPIDLAVEIASFAAAANPIFSGMSFVSEPADLDD